MNNRKLWIAFTSVIVISFSILLFFGSEIYHQAPPIPDKVLDSNGNTIFTGQDIRDGQNVWQSVGGQELGTVWGHGAYVAPDWTADWLHREAVLILNYWSMNKYNKGFDDLSPELKAMETEHLKQTLRTNTFNPQTNEIQLDEEQTVAINSLQTYYSKLFMGDKSLLATRSAYALRENAITDPVRMKQLSAFFFWASWACVTKRPGEEVSYTHNWPPDKLVGNEATPSLMLWTGFSVIMLLLGIGVLTFYHAQNKSDGIDIASLPKKDPLLGLSPTPSMKAIEKYFWVVVGLILVQVIFGVVAAHYGVEGKGLYGINLDNILPYPVSRAWHVQLAIFWIATSWLATGLYIAPAVSGFEPKYQKLGVNFLFICLLIIVIGSMSGIWMGIMQKLNLVQNFWFGNQGYEYVDLGRFWQTFLFIGLVLWLFLMVRALIPALKKRDESRELLIMFLISATAIALFYAAGFMWGRQTNLSIAEYWRWWVVHLWVEGFFEVFATVVSAFLFVRMGLLDIKKGTSGVLFSTIIFLSGGILGTFHHLYFAGTPTAVLALGATFSALEVVPLILIGFEAWHNLKLSHSTEWVKAYKWSIYSFIAVAFWNLVGAGIFGFLINPPIALYYMQGLNTTAVHGHTALFGVYGMLGIGLMLFVLKGLTGGKAWKDGVIKFAFWSMNIGLMLMVLLSLLPVGLSQTVASVSHGIWYARSPEFLHHGYMNTFKWMRLVGDTIFAIGTLALVWFVIGLKTGWSIDKKGMDVSNENYPSVHNK